MSCGQRNEKGMAVIFVAAIMLPIFYFLFTIMSDVGNYYAQRRTAQRVLDEAALFGERYLPYTSAAMAATNGYLARYNSVIPAETTTVSASANGI